MVNNDKYKYKQHNNKHQHNIKTNNVGNRDGDDNNY